MDKGRNMGIISVVHLMGLHRNTAIISVAHLMGHHRNIAISSAVQFMGKVRNMDIIKVRHPTEHHPSTVIIEIRECIG